MLYSEIKLLSVIGHYLIYIFSFSLQEVDGGGAIARE